MGLFDYVHINATDERFVCSEGHQLGGEEFQSKDFGCTMGDVLVVGNQIELQPGGWGDEMTRPLLGRFSVYATCHRCPAFVQAETFNVIGMSCDFEIECVDDVIRSVKRVSPTTAEFLHAEPRQPWMHNGRGPMSYEDARKRSMDRKFFPWDPVPVIDEESAEKQRQWRAEIDAYRAKRETRAIARLKGRVK